MIETKSSWTRRCKHWFQLESNQTMYKRWKCIDSCLPASFLLPRNEDKMDIPCRFFVKIYETNYSPRIKKINCVGKKRKEKMRVVPEKLLPHLPKTLEIWKKKTGLSKVRGTQFDCNCFSVWTFITSIKISKKQQKSYYIRNTKERSMHSRAQLWGSISRHCFNVYIYSLNKGRNNNNNFN